MKKKGLLTLGIFSILGIVIALVGAIGLKFDFSHLGDDADAIEYQEMISAADYQDGLERFEIQSVQSETIISFSEETSDNDIQILYYGDVQNFAITKNEQEIIINHGKYFNTKMWWNVFAHYSPTTKIEIIIPSSWQIQNFIVNLKAGRAMINNPSAHNQTYHLQSGTMEITKAYGNSLNLKNSMGTFKLLGKNVFGTITIDNDMGKISFEQLMFESLDFDVLSGTMTIGIVYDFDVLNVDITITSGKCNLTTSGNHPLFDITGSIRYGTVTFSLVQYSI